jgi:mRNA interferase MazF
VSARASWSRWDTIWLDLNPVRGSEQAGSCRPGIVVSANSMNARVPVLLVVPVTKADKQRSKYPFEVFIPAHEGGLQVDSIAMPQQLRSISPDRIVKPMGHITSPAIREQIEDALLYVLDIELDD